MTASSVGQPPSFSTAASISSNIFTFTANVKPIFAETPNGAAVSTSETPTISLRSTFNTAAPANHLPTELVAKILASGAWIQWSDLVALTHICQHWRNVALGTPQLWADAARSVFIEGGAWFSCLPTILARSVPCPISVDLLSIGNFTEAVEDRFNDSSLPPHLPQVTRLSVQLLHLSEFENFVEWVGPCMPNIESLHMFQVKRDFLGVTLDIDAKSMRVWCDTGFPHLHTLEIPAYCFARPIAVTSLKTLILYDDPCSYNEFLAALDRCAVGLESMILRGWKHPERVSRARNSTTLPIQLPSLRLFRASLSSQSPDTDPLAFLFASLSFSSDTTVQLDWKCNPGNTRELLPKHLVGLQVAPFFDSLCLHVSASPKFMATMHCYVGDAERLYVRERPLHPHRSKGRSLGDFLDEHRYSTASQLAVDLDMGPGHVGYVLSAHGDALQAFVHSLPDLRRLDLLGQSIWHAKLHFAKAFLSLPLPDDGLGSSSLLGSGQAAEGPGKTLGYVCEIPAEACKGKGISEDLAELEQLLKAHRAAGGARLRRLEICVVPASPDSGSLRPVYPYVQDVHPSAELTASVALVYSLRFKALVNEVVFIGHVERCGPGYRILPRSSQPVPMPRRSNRGGKGASGTMTASRRLDHPSRKAQ